MSRRTGVTRAGAGLAAPALLVGLAACTTNEARYCPNVEVMNGLDRIVQTGTGTSGTADKSAIAYGATIADVRSGCLIDQGGVTVDLRVTIIAQRGPAGAGLPHADITYFVAVTNRDREIIGKRQFTDRLVFDAAGRAQVVDDLKQRIPSPPTRSVVGDSVVLGFQLTSEQLDLNESKPGR